MDLFKLFVDQNSQSSFKYFQAGSISVLENNHISIWGRTDSTLSNIGYSNNSTTDYIVFRVDDNGNTKWATIIDYNYGYDSASKSFSYESTLYIGMVGDVNYPIIVSLNSTNGNLLKSNIFTFFATGTIYYRGKNFS